MQAGAFATEIERFARLAARLDDPFAEPTRELAEAGLTREAFDQVRRAWAERFGKDRTLVAQFRLLYEAERAIPDAERRPLVPDRPILPSTPPSSGWTARSDVLVDGDEPTMEVQEETLVMRDRPPSARLPFVPNAGAPAVAARSTPIEPRDPFGATAEEAGGIVKAALPFQTTDPTTSTNSGTTADDPASPPRDREKR